MPNLRTFIVEDSPGILRNLTAMLEEMTPVQVVGSAADESSASLRLSSMAASLDLVIIDIFLKEGSGMGVLRHVARQGLNLRSVVLTNYATPDMRQRCAALGAHRVFDKSIDLNELVQYCAALADGSSRNAVGDLADTGARAKPH